MGWSLRRADAVVVAVVASLLMAGCATVDEGAYGLEDDEAVAEADLAGAPTDGPPRLGPAVQRTYFLTTDGRLAPEAPEAGSLTLQGSYVDFARGVFNLNEFVSVDEPAPFLVLNEPIRFTFWVEATQPVPSPGTFDYVLWFGTTRSMPWVVVHNDGRHLMPGQVAKVEIVLRPATEEVQIVPLEEGLRLLMLSGMVHEGTGHLRLRVGADHASEVNLTVRQFSQDPLARLVPQEEAAFTGRLSNAALSDCAQHEDVTHHYHPVHIPEDARWVEFTSARVRSAPGVPQQDLDIDLFDGTRWLGGGHTPWAGEGILLADVTLEPYLGRELTLRATVCMAVDLEYRVTMHVA